MDESSNNNPSLEYLPLEVLGVQEITELPELRRIWDRDEQRWYYSVIDYVGLVTKSKNANVYWSALKKRNTNDPGFQALQQIKEFRLRGRDGRLRGAECVTRETMLRLV
jgi:hypothetical protein